MSAPGPSAALPLTLRLFLLGCAFLAASASAQPQETTQIAPREPQLRAAATPCSSHDPTEPGCPHRKKSVTLVPAFTKTTTPAPTTHRTTNHTTKHPTPHPTNHSSAPHPTSPHPSNHTTPPANHTAAPTTAGPQPTQPPFTPVGDYVVQAGSHTCLRVQAGLELRIRYTNKTKQQLWGGFSLQPNRTHVSGRCSNRTAALELSFPEGFLLFTFRKNETQNKFHLSRVQANVTYRFPQATEASFAADNSSLHTFEAQIGHSYQCRKKTIVLSEGFHLDALKEQVQAFGFQGIKFGPAEVCPEQRRSPILPIIVGVVLLVLILIVVVAFALGRWRSHRGYQTI